MKLSLPLALLALALAGCGAAQLPPSTSPAVPPAEATNAARRAEAIPYPTATDTPLPHAATATVAATATRVPAGTPTPATPSASALAGANCAEQSGGQAQPAALVAVRLAAQTGYDRLVFQFDKNIPVYHITAQPSAKFVEDGSGRAVTLQGASGLLIDLRPTAGHHASSDLKLAHGGSILEARQIGDFEGVTRWGVGLAKPACFRVLTLQSPPRLVVDVAA